MFELKGKINVYVINAIGFYFRLVKGKYSSSEDQVRGRVSSSKGFLAENTYLADGRNTEQAPLLYRSGSGSAASNR